MRNCNVSAAVCGREQLSVSPVSTVAVTGNTVIFNCKGRYDNDTNHPYTWLFNPLSGQPIVIAHDCQVSNLFDGNVLLCPGLLPVRVRASYMIA